MPFHVSGLSKPRRPGINTPAYIHLPPVRRDRFHSVACCVSSETSLEETRRRLFQLRWHATDIDHVAFGGFRVGRSGWVVRKTGTVVGLPELSYRSWVWARWASSFLFLYTSKCPCDATVISHPVNNDFWLLESSESTLKHIMNNTWRLWESIFWDIVYARALLRPKQNL
jgi:hypothetical protein